MTKYEWERQLKKGISNLPKSEQQRVLDYYNELFADKIDAGMREQYIIAEFGNPYDVANKILVDYYTDGKGSAEAEEYVYSPVDEIDDSFAEVPLKNKKTAAQAAADIDEEISPKEQKKEQRHKWTREEKTDIKKKASASGLIVLICVLIFFVMGACFNLWHPAWLIFLAMPVVTSFVEAIRKRNPKIFAYPVFVTLLYLFLGFYCGLWHPLWVLFITIPVYYVGIDFICKNTDKTDKSENVGKQSGAKIEETDEKPSEKEENDAPPKSKSKGGVKTFARVLLAIAGVFVIFWIWIAVIGMFIGGLGLMAGGVWGIVWLVMGNTTHVMVTVGGCLIAFGLGLVFTFGMASLFKACAKVSRELGKAMIGGDGAKENVQ